MNEETDIMMVTYNRLSLTKQTLESIIKNTDCKYNLIIIDNNSTDGTIEYLEKFSSFKDDNLLSIKIIKNSKNRGIAIGRNQGLLAAASNWLCTIDNDVLLPKGWLREAIEILKKNRQYGAIGVNMEGVSYPLIMLNGKEFQHKDKGNLGTACMVFNRSLHKMLGFFNFQDYGGYKTVAHYGMEDSDWGMRTRVIGFKLGYIKENGIHIGEGENDQGEYRKFKTESHKRNLSKFNANCGAYIQRRKSIYIDYKDG